MLVDAHCHLDSTFDLEVVIGRAKSEGVNKIITVGTSIESSKKSIEIANKYSTSDLKIYAAVGIYPKDGKNDVLGLGLYQCINTLKQLVKSSEKVVGVGECGLDYYLTTDKKQLTTDSEKEFQRELFEKHIKLAADLKLPLVIHCRNAWKDICDLLSNANRQLSNVTGVFHSWTGDWQAAQKALSLGFYISFSGIVTYKQSLQSSSITLTAGLKQSLQSSASPAGLKNAQKIQEVAKKTPLDRILIETDSPYLSPEPFRGAKNEPKNVRIVAQFIAGLRGMSVDRITEATAYNTINLFKLDNG